jgi:hypothetical protein
MYLFLQTTHVHKEAQYAYFPVVGSSVLTQQKLH